MSTSGGEGRGGIRARSFRCTLSDVELVSPSLQYEEGFRQAQEELRAAGEPAWGTESSFWEEFGSPETIADYIRVCAEYAEGRNMPEGWVPMTTYWLVDSREFIGESRLRHRLTDRLRVKGGHIGYHVRPSQRGKGYGKRILALTLEKAKEMGMDRVLVTCDETNTASRKVIEANGGVLERAQDLGPSRPKKLLFWIHL